MSKKFFVLLLIILSTVLSACNTVYNSEPGSDGTLLINGDVSGREIYKLKGTWRIIYNRWLPPEMKWDEILTLTKPLEIPGVFGDGDLKDVSDTSKGYGTLAVRIKAPKTHRERYAVETVYAATAFDMYANGTYIGSVGTIGKSAEATKGQINPIMGVFSSSGDEIVFMIHFSSYSNMLYIRDFLFGSESSVKFHYLLRLALDMVVIGASVLMALYHLSLYWLRRKDRSLLWFALICFTYCLRTLCVGNRFLVTLLPNIDSITFMRISYGSIFLMPMFIMHFLEGIYPRYTPKFIVRGMTAFSLFTVAITLFTSFNVFDRVMMTSNWVFVILVIAMITIIARAVMNKVTGSWVVSAGVITFSLTGVNDLLHEMGIIHTTSLTPLGLLVFLFTQAVMLSIVYSNAYARAEHLADENLRISEVLRINNMELENVVEERTKEIQEAHKALEIRNAELKRQAMTDPLTDLYNRRHLFELAEEMKPNRLYGMAVIDIDDFKRINDTYGHVSGDDVICALADHMKCIFHSPDVAARIGGEEFCVFSQIESTESFTDKLERFLECIRTKPCVSGESKIFYTVSIGYEISYGAIGADKLFLHSDTAVYQAKRGGKNRIVSFEYLEEDHTAFTE